MTSPIPARFALAAALLLASPLAGAQATGATLAEQAQAAYQGKDYARSAELFVAAARSAPEPADTLYGAACSFALAGQVEAAFAQLQASIDAGLGGVDPAADADLASLHADARFAPLMARFAAAHPEVVALTVLTDQSRPAEERYFAGRRAVAAGAPVADTTSLFNQYYATQAQFVGEYDEASRLYGFPATGEDPVAAGYTQAVDALPLVLERARGRRAVFLNESHGQSQTRAVAFALLAGLRAEGFDVLALETLATTPAVPRTPEQCADTSNDDVDLAARGYPLRRTGYYSQDPVYAETIREALRLGFRLVAYESVHASQAEREQGQAQNLACVFQADPGARLVVIAGFAHISERADYVVPGGMMARRFRALSGIDPLTVDTTRQLALREDTLVFTDAPTARRPLAYALRNADGVAYGTDHFDLGLFVPAPAHRNDGAPSWLELGGRRRGVAIAAAECGDQDPCLVEARRVGELAEAIASDRCVVASPLPGCTLFLAPGDYEIDAFDAAGRKLSARRLQVAPTP